ncbi:hypothetical protein AWW67_04425 [Roseivirga seohaensis]|uniref:Uncharacterized protein n=1 Tax=Roseivirga seohaensis TaxID=1914963 RepID=A0A150XZZ1_9BACT|nr:hypothetical protein [Roseivirga seohaensis]KYG84359.1 hypothetical protein AWW67_04425 [Roseivirga seohaensis]
MNLEAQKTGNMKSSLSEEKLSRHEKTLKKERDFSSKRELEPMAQVELNKRIDQSESDFSKQSI